MSISYHINEVVPLRYRNYYYWRYFDNDDMVFGYIYHRQSKPEGTYVHLKSFRLYEVVYVKSKEEWENLIVFEKAARGIS